MKTDSIIGDTSEYCAIIEDFTGYAMHRSLYIYKKHKKKYSLYKKIVEKGFELLYRYVVTELECK